MKVHFFIVSLLVLNFSNHKLSGQDTVLLFHPTIYNLEVIQNLLEEDIFALEEYHRVYLEKKEILTKGIGFKSRTPPWCSAPIINFQESIKDSDSHAFHLSYWNHLASILRLER